MGFFSILSDISKNKSNFKQWEQQERDNDAKRKALYERGVGKERLEEAKKRGDVIIDVITQMDQHSENFAEDIEQVTQPMAQMSGMLGVAGGLVGGGYYFYKTTEKGYKTFNKASIAIKDETAKAIDNQIHITYQDKIKNIIPENESNKILDELRSLRFGAECDNKIFKPKYLDKYKPYLSEESFKALKETHIPNYQKFWKGVKHHGAIAGAIAIATPILAYTLATLKTTNMQLRGSRIARWQSRNQLADAKNFVVFTPEQIAEAEEEVKKNKKPLTFREKLFGKKDKKQAGFWKNWYKYFKDSKDYEKWKAQDSDDSKKITRELTAEETKEAKLDQELIQRMVKKINNKAEEYSEDMETASAVILNLPIVAGPLIGTPLAWILEKSGTAQKISDSVFNKNAPKGYKEYLKQVTADGTKKSRFKRFIDFFKSQEKLSELINTEQAAKAADNAGKKVSNASPVKNIWRKIKVLASQTPATRRLASWAIVGAASAVVTSIIGLKLQKNAARAGRYIAREEFKDNPQEFLSYTDEEMQQVQDIKGKKPTLGEKFREWITFLPRCIKNVYKYDKYKKTTYQHQKDVHDELVKSAKVSDKQLLEAKNLQRKLFNTFEKVDEKSQAYSENMEAANEIATPLIYMGGYALTAAPFIAVFAGFLTGKFPVAKIGEWTAGLMAKVGGSKWGQKVQKEGIQSLAKTIEKMPDEKLPGNIQRILERFIPDGLNENTKLIDYLRHLEKNNNLEATEFINFIKAHSSEKLGTFLNVGALPKDVYTDIVANKITVGELLGKEGDGAKKVSALLQKWMPQEKLEKLKGKTVYDILIQRKIIDSEGRILPHLMDKTLNEVVGTDLAKIDVEKMTVGEFGKILQKAGKGPAEALSGMIKPMIPTREASFRFLRGFVELAPESTVKATLGKLSEKEIGSLKMGTIDRQYVIRMLNRLEKVMEKSANSGLKEEMNKLLQTMMQNPQKTLILLINHPEKLMSAFKSETLAKTLWAAGISWTVFTTILTYCLASYFASMQKDAGRLGVMKSIEDLQDYRYYADEIPENNSVNETKISETQIATKKNVFSSFDLSKKESV